MIGKSKKGYCHQIWYFIKAKFWQKMILWNHTRNQHNHPPEWMTDIHGGNEKLQLLVIN